MTIPELLALSDSELTVAFYRDVLGYRASNNTISGRWYVYPGVARAGLHSTESEAWAALPPVAPDVWLAELERLAKIGISFVIYDNSVHIVDYREHSPHLSKRYGVDGEPIEALRRAVMISSVYLSQKGKDE